MGAGRKRGQEFDVGQQWGTGLQLSWAVMVETALAVPSLLAK